MAGVAGFVGRERELARLGAVLGGDTRMVLVVGDAGVGKTRFAVEGMRQAAADGLVSVWGRCLPLAEKLPLLPVGDALGELSLLDGGRLLEAALAVVPEYVRVEVERLLPQLGSADTDAGGRGEGWRRERLFAAMAELLGAVAGRSGLGLVIEDVHWADTATLDCLTYLARASRRGPLIVVATCRSDEAPLDRQVADWLAHVRGGEGMEEIRLGPLSREEVAEQLAGLVGAPPPRRLVDDLYARGEGNPFFTERLVATVLAGSAGGGLHAPSGLPERLAELLVARAARCGGDGRAALAALAVAARPLTETMLCSITGLDADAVRRGCRDGGSEPRQPPVLSPLRRAPGHAPARPSTPAATGSPSPGSAAPSPVIPARPRLRGEPGGRCPRAPAHRNPRPVGSGQSARHLGPSVVQLRRVRRRRSRYEPTEVKRRDCWAVRLAQAGLVTACRRWPIADRTRKASVISMMP